MLWARQQQQQDVGRQQEAPTNHQPGSPHQQQHLQDTGRQQQDTPSSQKPGIPRMAPAPAEHREAAAAGFFEGQAAVGGMHAGGMRGTQPPQMPNSAAPQHMRNPAASPQMVNPAGAPQVPNAAVPTLAAFVPANAQHSQQAAQHIQVQDSWDSMQAAAAGQYEAGAGPSSGWQHTSNVPIDSSNGLPSWHSSGVQHAGGAVGPTPVPWQGYY